MGWAHCLLVSECTELPVCVISTRPHSWSCTHAGTLARTHTYTHTLFLIISPNVFLEKYRPQTLKVTSDKQKVPSTASQRASHKHPHPHRTDFCGGWLLLLYKVPGSG